MRAVRLSSYITRNHNTTLRAVAVVAPATRSRFCLSQLSRRLLLLAHSGDGGVGRSRWGGLELAALERLLPESEESVRELFGEMVRGSGCELLGELRIPPNFWVKVKV